MNDLIRLTQDGAVAQLVLNRPEKRNAINLPLLEDLDAALRQVERMAGLRTLIVRGEGKTFSAGVDPALFAAQAERFGPDWRLHSRAITAGAQAIFGRLERLELPTLCLIHGHCLGMALELALACDIRIAAEGAILGLPETRIGLLPDVGGTTRLTRLVGPARAKELIFSGRQFDAALAERWGIVNYVTPLDQLEARAMELAAEIGQAAPLAVGMAKRVIDGLSDLERGQQLEAWAQSLLFQSEDFQEAMASFMQRPPHFKGR
ncbi:MAG: enoyl-CoA hydratase/isomerase family protein [Caldilineales bacterium]|nr:enoyl-CoA hydratase/isomerase family protein [Caldilineales bacterium]MCW5860026.1 enoyl-CoA hydratase/isomerase family protein [Caldilineales bacterium]